MKNITITQKCQQNQKHVEILKNWKKHTQKNIKLKKNIKNYQKHENYEKYQKISKRQNIKIQVGENPRLAT